jgi:hypothetical protein
MVSAASTAFGDVEAALVLFENELSVDLPADMRAFSQARVALARVVNQYVAAEGERLELMLARNLPSLDCARRQTIHQELVALRMRYSEHIARWTSAGVAGDWQRYRSDSVSLIVGMRKILRERAAASTVCAA